MEGAGGWDQLHPLLFTKLQERSLNSPWLCKAYSGEIQHTGLCVDEQQEKQKTNVDKLLSYDTLSADSIWKGKHSLHRPINRAF